jgi:hypothetical protein
VRTPLPSYARPADHRAGLAAGLTRLARAVLLVALLAACSSPPGPPGPPEPPAPPAPPAPWRVEPGLTWQWQLTGPLDLTVPADVYELDGFTASAADVARLRAAGRRTICYVNAGAYEDFRPDAARYPAALRGRPNGWTGERWLDVRRWQVLEPVLLARLRMCRDKGFDAVEADNVDGYANDTGFALRAGDQLAFNRRVARLARGLGLAIGLKNDLGQAADLEPDFDFAVNEECVRYAECDRLAPFARAGKPVFHVEYDLPVAAACAGARPHGLTTIVKRPSLDAWRATC